MSQNSFLRIVLPLTDTPYRCSRYTNLFSNLRVRKSGSQPLLCGLYYGRRNGILFLPALLNRPVYLFGRVRDTSTVERFLCSGCVKVVVYFDCKYDLHVIGPLVS